MDLFDKADASSRDLSGPDATSRDTDYSLSLEEAGELYARAGHPRTLRSLQRYCVNGHLEARKTATAIGDKYLVTPQSVARHIAEIEELSALDHVAKRRDMSRLVAKALPLEQRDDIAPPAAETAATEPVLSRQVAPSPVQETVSESMVQATPIKSEASTASDRPRQVATELAATGESSRYISQLEHQLEMARDERDFLREQIDRKDKTIDSLIERDRETNHLVRGLQEMLTPLLGGRRREEPPHYVQ